MGSTALATNIPGLAIVVIFLWWEVRRLRHLQKEHHEWVQWSEQYSAWVAETWNSRERLRPIMHPHAYDFMTPGLPVRLGVDSWTPADLAPPQNYYDDAGNRVDLVG